MITTEKYQSHEIGSAGKLSGAQMEALVREFERLPQEAPDLLSGRIGPHKAFIDGLGHVMVKHYFRGGILGHINRRTYLKIGKTRGAEEFEILATVRSAGVRTLEPVAFASRTKNFIFYHAWLVTKEIKASGTLADLSGKDPSRAGAILSEAGKQIKTLIANGILHVDLHPGNVLVDAQDRVYIIDFDRAKTGVKNRRNLAKYYLNRWRRSVAKHGLPGFMNNLKVD